MQPRTRSLETPRTRQPGCFFSSGLACQHFIFRMTSIPPEDEGNRDLFAWAQVFDAKRLIGRKFNDPIVQSDIKLWPFKCVAGPSDKPLIVVTVEGEDTQRSPQIIASPNKELAREQHADIVVPALMRCLAGEEVPSGRDFVDGAP